MPRSILVTGGAGYIGSHTCKALAVRGYQPVVFDNLSRGYRSAVKWGPLVVGHLHDKDALRQAILTHNVDAVVHFAAFAYVEESVKAPSLYFHNNVVGSLNLFDVLTELKVNKIVFSSTCAVYGIPVNFPITEDTPTNPINPYGESKLQVEHMLAWYGAAYGLNSVALRYFNAAGCDPDGELGESHDPETHLLPLAIRAALGTGPVLQIRGTDYPTRDGTAIRDFVHVSDLAEAHVLALDYLDRGGVLGPFNLGTGNGTSIREVITAVARHTGCNVPTVETDRRAGDPPQLVANPGRANTILGWQPSRSDLDTVVKTATDWEARHYLQNAPYSRDGNR